MEKVMKKSPTCKICQLVTATKDELYEHMKRTHNPKYSCSECSFCCMIKNHFDYHYQSKHSGEKRYECTDCGYRCITRTMLTNHMKTHSSQYFRCKTCSFWTKTAADLKAHADEECHEVELVQDCRTNLAVQSAAVGSKKRTKHNAGKHFDEREPKTKRRFNVVSRRCFSMSKEVSLAQDLGSSSIPIDDDLMSISCPVSSASSASSQLILSNTKQIPVFPYGLAVTPDCRSSDIYLSKSLDHKFSRLPSAVGCSSEDPHNQVDQANIDNFRCSLCSFEAVSGNELLLHTFKIHRLTAKKSFDPVHSLGSYRMLQQDRGEDTRGQKSETGISVFSHNLLNAIVPNDKDAFGSSSGYEHSVDVDPTIEVSQSQLFSQRTSNKLQMSIECRTSELATKTGVIEAEWKMSKRITGKCTVTNQSSDQQNAQNDLSLVLHKYYDKRAVDPLDLSFSQSLSNANKALCGRGSHSESELAVLTVQSRRKGRTRKLDLSSIDSKEAETTNLNVALIEPVDQPPVASNVLGYEKPRVENSLTRNSPLNEALLSCSVDENKDSIFVNRELNKTHNYSSSTDFNVDSLKNQLPLISVSPNSLFYGSEENQTLRNSRVSEISNQLPSSYKINPTAAENRTSSNYLQSKAKASYGHESHEHWKYKCQHCLMNFKDSLMHQLHMGFHNFESPFRCNYCGKDNEDHLNFFRHLGEVAHPNLQS